MQSQRGIGLASGDGAGAFGMSVDNILVTVNAFGRDAQSFKFSVKPEAGAGAGIAVDKTEAGLSQV